MNDNKRETAPFLLPSFTAICNGEALRCKPSAAVLPEFVPPSEVAAQGAIISDADYERIIGCDYRL